MPELVQGRGCEWLDGEYRGPIQYYFFVYVATQLLQCLGSLPRELVLRPPEQSPASPIHRPPPPKDSPTNAAFMPRRQPDSSPALHTVSLKVRQDPASFQARQPVTTFKPGIVRQPSCPAACQLLNPA